MPLTDFIPFIQEVLEKNNGSIYAEKRNSDKTVSKFKVNSINDIENNREVNLNFYIVLNEFIDEKKSFYNDNFCQYIIEGTGGRIDKNIVERISLRLISKTSDKTIKKIFNAIKNMLKKNETIGIGVKGGSALHKNYFYEKSQINKKMVTDMYNDKAPVIEIL
ncbi:hypothetical protein V6246_05140 [Algibacter sp. TI.3.09]|uniref:hypothetical protein n=1 Tax=Algibacter sp. TI.3.09 TaxID=3121298 RepID=UPI00311EAEDA